MSRGWRVELAAALEKGNTARAVTAGEAMKVAEIPWEVEAMAPPRSHLPQ